MQALFTGFVLPYGLSTESVNGIDITRVSVFNVLESNELIGIHQIFPDVFYNSHLNW